MSAPKIEAVLLDMIRRPGASDILFAVGKPPQVECNGRLTPFDPNPDAASLTPSQTERIAMDLMCHDPELRKQLDQHGAVDCAYECTDRTRFRVNVFRVGGYLSAVLRVLPSEIPTMKQLGLPPVLGEICGLKNGLVLVTGSTGSGKSTTLASIIHELNRSRAVHIVTLEDPIEFRHEHHAATVNQRELGKDFPRFADGLRAALRQAPKVILVGEMRDAETVEVALKAAETGHLVLSTLHTIDAGQTIQRLVGMFEPEEQALCRTRLAGSLRYVISQRLLPDLKGGRVAALEIMGSSLGVRELIVNGESTERTLYDLIHEGTGFGWQTFDQHIAKLLAEGRIDEEIALAYCSRPNLMRRSIDHTRIQRGESTSDLGDLEMDTPKRLNR